MSGPVVLEGLDLAALLCSRVCHDLISPVGAIMNGLEVMEENKDEETSKFAMDLIKKSAKTASATRVPQASGKASAMKPWVSA